MTPPYCTRRGCKRLVRRHRGVRFPQRGARIIDGVSWNWFCSRKCGGKMLGASRSPEVIRRAAENSAIGRRRAAERRWLESVEQDVAVLVHYGVPKPVARATLLRLAERFEKRGREKVRYELVVRPRQQAQTAARVSA